MILNTSEIHRSLLVASWSPMYDLEYQPIRGRRTVSNEEAEEAKII